ncbi:MAG: 2,3-bisphosphoglycerate-independent phosphoglycerate mutase [Parcubacteria group bacterium]|jgi:2,3-bisphosphoglycerate-independent phosphoglycerate mutase
MYKPTVLVILDGWGISNNTQGNILKTTLLPTFEKLNNFYPMTTLQASGISVGLPWGECGNSEVGHITLGAGKIIYQNLPRISLSIQDGSFFKNEVLIDIFKKTLANKGDLHLMGLTGTGSVHSYMDHLFALLEMSKEQGLKNVFIHAFTDGRDSAPTSGIKTIQAIEEKTTAIGVGRIATVCGRNWSMDRNNNWDRVEKAYSMLTEGKGEQIQNPIKYLQDSYVKGITDEYIEPGVVNENEKPVALIKDNDSVIFFNFREDRARELTAAFVVPSFDKFPRKKRLKIEFVTMIEYEKDLPAEIVFPKEKLTNGLGEILSKDKKKQLRISETEKYAHVTYFFNGGKEDSWPDEDRILIPSPSVSKFDESPEMSAPKITEKILESVEEKKYDFILVNYANADMVGHTGNEKACVEAVKSLDKSLSLIIPAILKVGGCLLITADHGNIEELKNPSTGQIDTEHSTNPVPAWYITPENHRNKTPEEMKQDESEIGGLLSDIAPTVLDIMGVQKPPEMSGESLLPVLK